ncbi:MAG: type II CRISPR-associated endonuclease Cas1 [Planctomycetes bacterium]|nr:type II CRISPR-associated endonuclease Cas1 [Planctomycetota bacterium]
MPDRILDFSEEAVRLCVRHSNLVIRRADDSEVSLPLRDVAVVVVSHPAVSLTHPVLAGLAAAGATFVSCDDTRLPVGMMVPLQGNFVQAERLAAQVAATRPTGKRLWQSVVRAKVRAQAAVLVLEHGDDGGLASLADRVRSGDPDNIEAQVARAYWPQVFGDPRFERTRTAEDLNRHLNYGYTVLRAMTARAICAAGLHPCLGIHHHNRYSQFTLADDLMEPLRPVVDRAVLSIARTWGTDVAVTKETKAHMFEHLTARFCYRGEQRALFDVLTGISTSLLAVYEGRRKELDLPTFPMFFSDGVTE